MQTVAIPLTLFSRLFNAFAFAPLLLLIGLFFVRDRTRRWFFASFILLLPAPLLAGLWVATNGDTEPRFGDVGAGVVIFSVFWGALACALSLSCGMFCARSYRWALLWMIPEVLILLYLGITFVRAFI
jgi:hypothetical protein